MLLIGLKAKMKKSTKILLGLATLWPFIYMILFVAFVFSMILWAPSSEGQNSGVPLSFAVFMVFHVLTMLWMVGLTIIYMVDVFRNERVEKDYKVLWAVVIFMGNLFAMPIYWYLYLWREPPVIKSADASTLETRIG